MTRYDPRIMTYRLLNYNKHRLHPYLDLESKTAWALSFEAGRRRMWISDLLEAIVESWGRAYIEQLGETDRRSFLDSIPRAAGGKGHVKG